MLADPKGQLELVGSVGAFDLTGTVRVAVRHSDGKVVSADYTGTGDDVYDFNITRTNFLLQTNLAGAKVQAGWPNLGGGGKVFRAQPSFTAQGVDIGFSFPVTW